MDAFNLSSIAQMVPNHVKHYYKQLFYDCEFWIYSSETFWTLVQLFSWQKTFLMLPLRTSVAFITIRYSQNKI